MRGEAREAAGLLLIVAAGAVCGCGEDGSIGPPTAVNAELVDFDLIRFSWSPPSKADALEAEASIESGPWQWLGAGPGGVTRVEVTLGPTAPEAATYAFRVRAWRGEAHSEWSEVATVFRGVRPATDLEALASSFDGPILLTWTRGSTQAQVIRLDRRVVQRDGSAGPWSELEGVALDATSFTDSDTASWLDGACLEYRIVYVKDGTESDPAVARTAQAPLLAPAGP